MTAYELALRVAMEGTGGGYVYRHRPFARDLANLPLPPFNQGQLCPKCGSSVIASLHTEAEKGVPEEQCEPCKGTGKFQYGYYRRSWSLLRREWVVTETRLCVLCRGEGKRPAVPARPEAVVRACSCGWTTIQAPLDADVQEK